MTLATARGTIKRLVASRGSKLAGQKEAIVRAAQWTARMRTPPGDSL